MRPVNLQRRVQRSPWLQRAYATACAASARVSAGAGHPFSAVRALLRARKHVDPECFGRGNDRLLEGLLSRTTRNLDGSLRTSRENGLRRDFVTSAEARRIRDEYSTYPLDDRVRLRKPRPADDPERQGNLILLKEHDPRTGEKGVLLVAFNYSILHLPALFDLPALAERYAIVLEPSWWGYQDARLYLYLGSDVDVLVEAQRRPDFDFLRDSGTNLVPVRLGAGDWGDPFTFEPKPGPDRAYDVAMVAAWDPFKRHEVLFRALERIRRERGRRLKVALVGYPMRWTRQRVHRLMERFGVTSDCMVFERVPHREVARVLADSRVSVLLSRGEGANKAIYESLFCGTPVVVTRGHLGVNLDHVTPRSGRLAGDDELAEVLIDVLENREGLDPRGWALENTGWPVATRLLEASLEGLARRRGTPWTRGIEPRKKTPGNRYARPGAHRAFASEYERLSRYLLPR